MKNGIVAAAEHWAEVLLSGSTCGKYIEYAEEARRVLPTITSTDTADQLAGVFGGIAYKVREQANETGSFDACAAAGLMESITNEAKQRKAYLEAEAERLSAHFTFQVID